MTVTTTIHQAIVVTGLRLVCAHCGVELDRAPKDERGRYARHPFVGVASGKPECGA